MKVVDYLKEHSLEQLHNDYGIKIKEYPNDNSIVLNYNQIDTGELGSKVHPIIMECRGLILDYDYNIISRTFDRFFNIGEALEITEEFDIRKATAYEKVDGSLISLYYNNDNWQFATRGTAFAEAENYTGNTFLSMILALFNAGCMQEVSDEYKSINLSTDFTYIFEFISPDNRIVTHYENAQLVFLGARHLQSGALVSHNSLPIPLLFKIDCNKDANIRIPSSHSFDTREELAEYIEGLTDLQEGLVLYDYINNIRVKVKNSVYLAVHRLRGDTIPTPKKIMGLVVTGETEEYLVYFPTELERFTPYITAYNDLIDDIEKTYSKYSYITDQKEFALAVKDLCYSWVLFKGRKDTINRIDDIFHNADISLKIKTLTSYMSSK